MNESLRWSTILVANRRFNILKAYLEETSRASGRVFCICSCRWARSFLSASKKYVAVMWLYSFLSSALQEDPIDKNYNWLNRAEDARLKYTNTQKGTIKTVISS